MKMKKLKEDWKYVIVEKRLVLMIAILFFLWNVIWQTLVEKLLEQEYWGTTIEKATWVSIIFLFVICAILLYEIAIHYIKKNQVKILLIWISTTCLLGLICGLMGEMIYRFGMLSFSTVKLSMYYVSIVGQQILRILMIYYLFNSIYEIEKKAHILREVIMKVMLGSFAYWFLDMQVNFNDIVNILMEDVILIIMIVMFGSRVKSNKKRG